MRPYSLAQFLFNNLLVVRHNLLIRTVQALEVNLSLKLRKMGFTCKKKQNSFPKFHFGKIQFSQKFLAHKEKQPDGLPQEDLVQQNEMVQKKLKW